MDTVKKLTNWDQVDNAIKDIADAIRVIKFYYLKI